MNSHTKENILQILDKLRGHLIVSVQAADGHAQRNSLVISRLALAAVNGGSVAIRCGGVGGIKDIRAVRELVDVPIIGLTKRGSNGVYITPTIDDARAILHAGAEIVAFDGTRRPRPDGSTLVDMVEAIHEQRGYAMADISTVDEGQDAYHAGCDIIGTTLAGYTPYSQHMPTPNIRLVELLREQLPKAAFIVAEGRYATPEQCKEALSKGATSVVVGTAITDITATTHKFVAAIAVP